MGKVNVGVVGVGNCASSLVQGVAYYSGHPEVTVGLPRRVCAGYDVADIRFTSAFDVDAGKVGADLSEALRCPPNNAAGFADVGHLGVPVRDGVLADGLGPQAAERLRVRGRATVAEVAGHLRQTGTEVLLNLLPTGSQRAAEAYAEAALTAGCAYVNCMPAVLARSQTWAARFRDAGLPLLGDDLKSQFGSTLVHRALVQALAANGVELRNTYQLNHGGNMDFLTLQDPGRMATKARSKQAGLAAGGTPPSPAGGNHVGTGYVPFLADRKVAYLRLEGTAFGGTEVAIDMRLTVEDSPSGAGAMLDAVRYAKAALLSRCPEIADAASTLLMKAPGTPTSEDAATAVLAGLSGPAGGRS